MDEDQKRSLGAVVRTLREARGLSRQDLVERTGTDPSDRVSLEMLAKVEQGKKAPSARTLRKLAKALGMEPTELAHTAAWWELNQLDGASASLLRLSVTQGLALGAALGAGGVGSMARLAAPLVGRVAPLVGASAIGGIALSRELADRKALSAWLQEQARLVEDGPESAVAEVTEVLGLALLEAARRQERSEPPAEGPESDEAFPGGVAREPGETVKSPK